jgi:hypothetical protein
MTRTARILPRFRQPAIRPVDGVLLGVAALVLSATAKSDMMDAMSRLVWCAVLALAVLACGPRGVKVRHVSTSVQPPANVALYVAVTQKGEPLTGLTPQSFTLVEDGLELDPAQVQLRLLAKSRAVVHHTVLLLDVSSAQDPAARAQLARAAEGFVRRVRGSQGVSVLAFDGAPDLVSVAEVPRAEGGAETVELAGLETVAVRDASRNLNGAVIEALNHLDQVLAASAKPVRVGTLVVYTTGPEMAGRVARDRLTDRLEQSRHLAILVATGKTDAMPVKDLGTSGVIQVETPAMVGVALTRAAQRVEALHASHYLVSYCSPARDGVRTLSVIVSATGDKGREQRGGVKARFSAQGFRAGCSSDEAPRFLVTTVATDSGTVPGIAPPGAEPVALSAEPAKEEPKTDANETKEPDEPKEEAKLEPKPKKKRARRPRPRPAAKKRPPKPAAKKPPPEPKKPAAEPPSKPAPKPKSDGEWEP